MNIECYISEACHSEKALRHNLSEALRLEAGDATVTVHRISDDEAEKRGLKGSPSVLINGRDIFPGEIPGFS